MSLSGSTATSVAIPFYYTSRLYQCGVPRRRLCYARLPVHEKRKPWLDNLFVVLRNLLLHNDGLTERSLQTAQPLLLHSQTARMMVQPASLTTRCLAGPQLLQNSGVPERSLQTAKPVLYTLPDCLYTIPASKPCSGPSSVGCSIPGQCTDAQLPGGCCQVGFKCT